MSNYYHSKLGKSVAYVELNASKQISRLHNHLFFSIYPEVTFSSLVSILSQPFDVFILDMGVLSPSNWGEFFRYKHQIVIGSVIPWKCFVFEKFIDDINKKNKTMDSIILLANLGIKEQLQKMNRKHHLSISAIPFLSNPFLITSDNFDFFERMVRQL